MIHTTNGSKGSAFAAEARYLRDNNQDAPVRRVSAHYLVGKQGQIAQIVPDYLAAYHAGATLPGFQNSRSLGIECHLTPGEVWTPAQRDALTWLVEDRMAHWLITRRWVDMHRAVAIPKGRKSDPAEWPDTSFYAWRDALGLIVPARHQVIGVKPSIDLARFTQLLRTRKAPFDPAYFDVIAERIYRLNSDLDTDPAFWLAMWTREQFEDRQLGNSEIGRATRNPLNIKAYGRWPAIAMKGALWNVYESWQLGCLHSVMHIKQFYGAEGLLHVETIIPIWAPETNGNDPAAYIAAVNADMEAMQT